MNESRLTRLKDAGKTKYSKSLGLYQCECGTQKIIEDYSVKIGKTKSCGCYHRECIQNPNIQRKRGKVGGLAIRGREPETKGKIRIFEFYSTKSKPLGRSKWVTEDELSKIYHGILPDPFA